MPRSSEISLVVTKKIFKRKAMSDIAQVESSGPVGVGMTSRVYSEDVFCAPPGVSMKTIGMSYVFYGYERQATISHIGLG